MNLRDQSTQTDQYTSESRQFRGSRARDGLKFLSSLILPLVLGVFTFVIAIQQENTARQHRDLERNLSAEDRNQANLQRQLEVYLNEERYKNELLDTYVKEMGELLEKYHGSLTNSSVVATLSRVKTLNTFRQLDAQRNIRIVRFLYEAKQLTHREENLPLDLSIAILRDIDFRNCAINGKQLNDFSLTGVFLTNDTFLDIEIKYGNFSRTQFDLVNFSLSQLDHIDFSLAELKNTNFSNTQLDTIAFTLTKWDNVEFISAQLKNVSFAMAKLAKISFSFGLIENIDFSSVELDNVSFSSTQLFNIDFRNATLNNIDFSFALLKNVSFTDSELNGVNFSSARLQSVEFLSAELRQVDFRSIKPSSIDLSNIRFNSGILDLVNFTSAKLYNVSFVSSLQHYVNYSSTILSSVNFGSARIYNTEYNQARCIAAHFNFSKLSSVNFLHADAKNAFFNNAELIAVNFLLANLHKADFTNTTIAVEQLHQALSIQDVRLPNKSIAYGENLIRNGQANCESILKDRWIVQTGSIGITPFDENQNNCGFQLQSNGDGATMLQRINLSNVLNYEFWPHSQAVFRARIGSGVIIQLTSIGKVLVKKNMTFSSIINLHLPEYIQELEILVYFNATTSQIERKSRWCDDLELFIHYKKSEIESFRIDPIISLNANWKQNATSIAGGTGSNELNFPRGIYVDDDGTVLIADRMNNRIVQWKPDPINSQVVASSSEIGNRTIQLSMPSDLIVDKETNSLIICDSGIGRVMRWSRENELRVEIIIGDIACSGLTMDNQRFLYVSDYLKHDVKRYHMIELIGKRVAGGNGKCSGSDQFDTPTFVVVDKDYSLYVSDTSNHRVMKWIKDAQQRIVVAGGRGQGSALTQLSYPRGIFVDHMGTVYVAEEGNDRVTRWHNGTTKGSVVVGGNGEGKQENRFNGPADLSFDQHGNLYVVDCWNHRVQRFSIE